MVMVVMFMVMMMVVIVSVIMVMVFVFMVMMVTMLVMMVVRMFMMMTMLMMVLMRITGVLFLSQHHHVNTRSLYATGCARLHAHFRLRNPRAVKAPDKAFPVRMQLQKCCREHIARGTHSAIKKQHFHKGNIARFLRCRNSLLVFRPYCGMIVGRIFMEKKPFFELRKLVTLALLAALYIVLERFLSFNVWNMRIGFAFVALAVSGMLFGPLAAGLVGAVGDILGMMLFPTGPYFPGFTLTAFLTGAVFGLFLHRQQRPGHIIGAVAVNQILLSLFLQTLWISITYGASYRALLPTRMTQCLIMIPLQLAVLFLIAKPAALVARRMQLTT